MNPTDPNAVPPADLPVDPGALLPDGALPPLAPKPWQKPQQQPNPQTDGGTGAVDGGGAGDLVDAGVEGASLGADIISGAADIAGGAIEIAGTVAGGAIEAAGSIAGGALEGAGGCADGCGGCSLAVLITLFAAAGTALAVFR